MNPGAPECTDAGEIRRARVWRRHHLEMLVGALVVIALTVALKVGTDGCVQVTGCPGLRMPPLCGSQVLFGIERPGCRLTRSLVLLAHGRWQESVAMHRVGWLLALALLVQIPYRFAALRLREPLPLGVWVPRLFGGLLIAALVGNWLVKQCGG